MVYVRNEQNPDSVQENHSEHDSLRWRKMNRESYVDNESCEVGD